MPDDDHHERRDLVQGIAARLRRQRAQQGLSMSELARLSGVAKGTLSMLEAGRGNPTVETLGAIAAALGLPLGDLVADVGAPAVSVLRGLPADEARGPRLLHRQASGMFIEMWHLRLDPGAHLEREGHAPGTLEHILVVAGTLTTGPAEAAQRLSPGDFCVYRADVPHIYIAGGSPVEAAMLMSYPAAFPSRTPKSA